MPKDKVSLFPITSRPNYSGAPCPFGKSFLVGKKLADKFMDGVTARLHNWYSEYLLSCRKVSCIKRQPGKNIEKRETQKNKSFTRYFLSIWTKGLSSGRWLQAQAQQEDICVQFSTHLHSFKSVCCRFLFSKEVNSESFGETHRLHWARQQQLDLPMSAETPHTPHKRDSSKNEVCVKWKI